MPAVRWVVMGVSGCGKSAVGSLLADALHVPYVEGDDVHAPENVAKMAAGIALDDADRAGWLAALHERIGTARAQGSGLVVSCSALKRAYRTLYKSGLMLDEARAKLVEDAKLQPDVQLLVDFLNISKRGIIR